VRIFAILSADTRVRCFTAAAWARLETLGQFRWISDFSGQTPVVEWARRCHEAEILITGWGSPPLRAAVLDSMPHLKMIAHSAGTVASVDFQAWRRGIAVTNVMPIMALGVAEFTLTCMLGGLRRFDALLKPALWDSSPFFRVPKVAFALRGKKVGLIGFGIIAREVLSLLRPFGCTILVHDPFLDPAALLAQGIQPASLDELLAACDIVSLHAPGVPANADLLNERRLRRLKPGAILINTARGILIDHDALARVAADGQIGVYLDVTRPEPLPPDHPLRQLNNVVLTPHVAGPTVEGWPMMGEACVEDVARFVRGEPLKYPVTEAQYANQSTS
jgi:phosphoglycerate dehydrogenase-like enzyme